MIQKIALLVLISIALLLLGACKAEGGAKALLRFAYMTSDETLSEQATDVYEEIVTNNITNYIANPKMGYRAEVIFDGVTFDVSDLKDSALSSEYKEVQAKAPHVIHCHASYSQTNYATNGEATVGTTTEEPIHFDFVDQFLGYEFEPSVRYTIEITGAYVAKDEIN